MGLWTWLTDRDGSKARRVEERVKHYEFLVTAASVAKIDLVCRDDLWAFTEKQTRALQEEAFQPPSEDLIIRDEGMVTVPLSGTNLAAVLEAMFHLDTAPDTSRVARAQAVQVYISITSVLGLVSPMSDRDNPLIPIVIDDRIRRRQPDPDGPATATP
ncbi:hypothetical protein ACH4U6_16050 [Streptomyces netropsis]|uniref:hypothetical protein n=1 Tax=Streptomyces netropsis TaxID=55404 RepID=UPI00379C2658